MKQIELSVCKADIGERLDKFLLKNLSDYTRNALQKLIGEGSVLVNEKSVAKSHKLINNDKITIHIKEPKSLEIKEENIPLQIVYEDNDLLVVNKPQGMVVHPAVGNYEGTLVNALLAHCGNSLSGINGVIRPGIVHRIDKNTSGLIIVAKNDFSHNALAKQIKEHNFKRIYETIVIGNMKNNEGIINAPIGRSTNDRKKMTVTEKNSKNAITHYKVIEGFKGYTHLRCQLETGRTHQIRVHLRSISHSVLGDSVYGQKTNPFGLDGQCLHAKVIGFIHPRTNEYLEFESELPEYFNNVLTKLQNEYKF